MPAVQGALRFLLRRWRRRSGWPSATAQRWKRHRGLTVLAMGKYGAHELNYSSDIDLVVFYDADKFPFAKRGDPRGAAVDIVRGLVKLIAETTRRRLCLPRRSAAAARCRRHPGGDLHRRGAGLL